MRRGLVLTVLMAIGSLTVGTTAYQALPQPALDATRIEQVKDNLYVITGSDPTNREAFSGGNTGVFITDAGVVVVDTKLAGWGDVLLERIRTVTDKPVVAIINTHTHGDHTGSNAFFEPSVDIVAHANTQINMRRMEAFQGAGAAYLPKRTFTDRMSLGAGSGQIDLYHFGPGHTNGDAFVVYPSLRVMQTGDMFPWKDAPFIDRANGGSGLEYPNTLAKALAGVTNVDTIVPGHMPVTTRSAMEQYQQFMTDLVAAVREVKDNGRTVEQAVASIDLTSRYPEFKTNRMQAAIETIYEELGN
jgi:glyoxylase-like metal-dependent hydrolase (beta-lactamase superfamily II)